jgi:hypothetical protein
MRQAARPLLSPSRRGALVGALCGLAAWALAQQPLLRGLEDWLQDASFAWLSIETRRGFPPVRPRGTAVEPIPAGTAGPTPNCVLQQSGRAGQP